MRKPLLRIPYTDLLSPPTVTPRSASSLPGAVAALETFLTTPSRNNLPPSSTVILSGAGLSVPSGLADYRGVKGTYRVNKTYRPIYHHEFLSSHEARKRYWARSFLGWPTLHKASPNVGHYAIRDLGALGLVRGVITQNVDSFHAQAHPSIPTVELHGYLRSTVCVTCGTETSRDVFQRDLARLNPRWAAFLEEVLASGALDSEDPAERAAKGMRANPDGDVDLPGAPYTTFRYPACEICLSRSGRGAEGSTSDEKPVTVQVDRDGAWLPPALTGGASAPAPAGILKPAVVMFGESIAPDVKTDAEKAIDSAGKLLVLGTSLATYSAWRLARRALDRGMPICVVNLGGVRGEAHFFTPEDEGEGEGERRVRVEMATDVLLPALVERLGSVGVGGGLWTGSGAGSGAGVSTPGASPGGDALKGEGGEKKTRHGAFKDMLS